MRWPWRRQGNGEVEQAIRDAEQQKINADQRSPHVDRTARKAQALTRRGDLFAREVERSWHLRRGST